MVVSDSYKELGLLMQYITVATVVVDDKGVIEECNDAFREQFVFAAGEVRGRDLYDIVPSKEILEQLRACNPKNDVGHEFVISYMQNTHTLCWCRIEIVPLRIPATYILVFYDLTEQYQTQAIMQAHLMVSNDIFFFFDAKDRVLQCSNKAAGLFDFASSLDVIGLHYSTLMQGKIDNEVMLTIFRKVHQQENFLGYISLNRQGIASYYELSAFHVNLRAISTGVVIMLRQLEDGELIEEEAIVESPELHEENGWDMLKPQPELLYWGSKECTEAIEELSTALLHYEYMEINRLLYALSLLAPGEAYMALQEMQEAIDAFQYEKAYDIFMEAHFVNK